MRRLLAKPDETLVEHVETCLNIWNELKEKYYHFIPDDDFWDKSLLTVLFHDIGKIIDSFQEMMAKIRKGKRPNYNNNFRHELFSGIVLAKFVNQDLLPLTAVFSHHKKMNEELFINDQYLKVNYDISDIVEYVKYFSNNLDSNFEKFPLWKYGESFYNGFFKLIFERLHSVNKDDRIKYIFYKGILNTCDWLASGHSEILPDLKIRSEKLKNKIEKKIGKKINFDSFQIECSESQINCLSIAPTGSGKTEAALLWAGSKSGKIIYLLPTKVTSNAIYERLVKYFGVKEIGLVHSSALDYYNEREDNYKVKDYLIEKTFCKPITVGTIDQLLTIGFNIGHWTVKSLNCVGAKIIIDEIHAYDFYTLGLTISIIKYFKELGAMFFLMSATIPNFLKDLFISEIQEIQIIENTTLLQDARNLFIVKDKFIDDLDNEIIESLKNNKKVLIVVNTVDEAIRIYEKYKQFGPICYHSRFIVKHRKLKEDKIVKVSQLNEGCLVITTQVVEVSLDIDFDILFTENAPADAIIQRAGRVNRKREKSDTKIIIFKHQDITEQKIYDKNILRKTFEVFKNYNNLRISEESFLEIANKVYKDVIITEIDDYKEGLKKYDKIQEHFKFIQDVMPSNEKIFTRIIDYLKLSVIPDKFLNQIYDMDFRGKSKYQVDIPLWVKAQPIYNIRREDDGFYYGNIDYSFKRGAKLSKSSPLKTKTGFY
jgi:CRISPR-associated endonuclease/helicase Cas3